MDASMTFAVPALPSGAGEQLAPLRVERPRTGSVGSQGRRRAPPPTLNLHINNRDTPSCRTAPSYPRPPTLSIPNSSSRQPSSAASSLAPPPPTPSNSKRPRNVKNLMLVSLSPYSTTHTHTLLSLAPTPTPSTSAFPPARSAPSSPRAAEGPGAGLSGVLKGRVKRRPSITLVPPSQPPPLDDHPSVMGLLAGREGLEGDEMERGVKREFPYSRGALEILPNLYLGSEDNAKDSALLRRLDIRFVLNVAKEVACPAWRADGPENEVRSLFSVPPAARARASSDATPELIPEEEEEEEEEEETPASSPVDDALSHPHPHPHLSPLRAPRPPSGATPPRMHLVRPTASTPNLHASYQTSSSSSQTISSTSSSQSTIRPPTSLFPPTRYFPANPTTGRPALEYAHLSWSHGQPDLVGEGGEFERAFAFLDRALGEDGCAGRGGVLVHCQCGVSRSATLAVAYVMRQAARGHLPHLLSGVTGMHAAYDLVKHRSPHIGPNISLIFQLVELERVLAFASAPAEEAEEEWGRRRLAMDLDPSPASSSPSSPSPSSSSSRDDTQMEWESSSRSPGLSDAPTTPEVAEQQVAAKATASPPRRPRLRLSRSTFASTLETVPPSPIDPSVSAPAPAPASVPFTFLSAPPTSTVAPPTPTLLSPPLSPFTAKPLPHPASPERSPAAPAPVVTSPFRGAAIQSATQRRAAHRRAFSHEWVGVGVGVGVGARTEEAGGEGS